MKAGNEAGVDIKYYTFGAHMNGSPTAMGDGGGDRVIATLEGHDNMGAELGNAAAEAWVAGWRATDPGFDYPWINFQVMMDMVAEAVKKAGSTDALKVALALEGIQAPDIYGNVNTMRKDDHQMISPFHTALFTKGVKNISENTGWGWKTQSTASSSDLTFPTQCKMKRPSGA